MPIGTRKPSTHKSQKEDAVVVTTGEIFADGVIDLVTSTDPRRPNLISWDGHRVRIAARIRRGHLCYQAPQLHPSVGRGIRFPSRADQSGSAMELFSVVSDLFQKYLGLSDELARQLTLFQASTWLSDRLPNPPILIAVGSQMSRAVDFFRLLECGCRRPLVLTGISRAALGALPMELRPTLFVNQPDLPSGMSKLLSAANHRGVYVLGRGGAIQDWACSKAIFLESATSANVWRGKAIWITLPTAERDLPPLSESSLNRLSEDLQAKFLGFRLNWLSKEQAGSAGGKLPFPGNELAHSLFSCVRHEPDLVKTITPLIRGLVEDEMVYQNLDSDVAILEVLWNPGHETPYLSVTKITERLNVLLRTRGSRSEHSEEEVGWMLKGHGFSRHRNASGMVLRFSAENSLQLHQLVRKFGLDLPKLQDCCNCAKPESQLRKVSDV